MGNSWGPMKRQATKSLPRGFDSPPGEHRGSRVPTARNLETDCGQMTRTVTKTRSRMNCSTLRCCIAIWTAAGACGWERAEAEQPPPAEPVFQVDVANPTRDKPQSKLWFSHDSWWAWLPTRQGSSVWRRTAGGWQRQTALDRSLVGLPNRADVWAEGDAVRAVLVDGRRLAVVELVYSAEHSAYQPAGQSARFQVGDDESDGEIETATIARDSRDRWWIAYPWQRRMWVRSIARCNRERMDRANPPRSRNGRGRSVRDCPPAGQRRAGVVGSGSRNNVLLLAQGRRGHKQLGTA